MPENARLEPLEERHFQNIYRWVNDPDLRMQIGTVRPISQAENAEYQRSAAQDRHRIHLAVVDAHDGRHVGMIGLNNIDFVYRRADIWLYVGDATARRRHIGRSAASQLLDYAFGTLGLHRVRAEVFAFNEAALRFFAALGMKEEGRQREAAFKLGRFWDVVAFAILDREWFERRDLEAPRLPHVALEPLADEVIRANREFHARLAGEYFQSQPYGSAENRGRVRAILEEMAGHAGGGRLLDVGCGTGFVLDLAHDLFRELHGVDICPEMIARVTPRQNVRVCLAPVEHLPFGNGCFDAVTAYGVLHHIYDLTVALREIRRVLRRGGLFYADESPNLDFRENARRHRAAGTLGSLGGKEIISVTEDVRRYGERHGLEPAIVERAMFQDKIRGGLAVEALEAALANAGFVGIAVTPRWFAGQGTILRTQGAEAVARTEQYLRDVLPLSRGLFKYLVVRAVAGN